jgi:altronate hydrolase
MEQPGWIRLRPEDNVAVATRNLVAGTTLSVDGARVTLRDPIVLGHKIALRDVPAGDAVIKYGQVIGNASAAIPAGSHVHVHNVDALAFDRDYAISSAVPAPPPKPSRERTFRGYLREDGRAGTRNYVAIISTVNCSASTSRLIAERFPRELLARFPNVDGILPITHKTGCGMAYDSPDHEQLDRVLSGFARHPNVAGYVLVGLGCEVAQISHLTAREKLVPVESLTLSGQRTPTAGSVPTISIQEAGGVAKTVARGIEALEGILARADRARRVDLPASLLVLGTQCGGSDGNSGVTANPALGHASDILVAHGGTSVLAETTEMYGAEHLLTRRAVSREVGEALIERIRWWEWYTSVFGAEINNNPSPGNKAGGLTTIYEKSLGAIAKGGTTALRAVYRYAEPIREKGFVIMDTPGYDPVSLTGIVAGGANICVFTTGRGSVYGCKPSPCIKVSTNTPLYQRLGDDMDLDAGRILAGASVEQIGEEIFEEMLVVASGKKTKSEAQGLGEEEFAPWTLGPVL